MYLLVCLCSVFVQYVVIYCVMLSGSVLCFCDFEFVCVRDLVLCVCCLRFNVRCCMGCFCVVCGCLCLCVLCFVAFVCLCVFAFFELI